MFCARCVSLPTVHPVENAKRAVRSARPTQDIFCCFLPAAHVPALILHTPLASAAAAAQTHTQTLPVPLRAATPNAHHRHLPLLTTARFSKCLHSRTVLVLATPLASCACVTRILHKITLHMNYMNRKPLHPYTCFCLHYILVRNPPLREPYPTCQQRLVPMSVFSSPSSHSALHVYHLHMLYKCTACTNIPVPTTSLYMPLIPSHSSTCAALIGLRDNRHCQFTYFIRASRS